MELIKTGIEGLDEVLYGGVIPENTILVEGTPGAGKTTLGLQYIYYGAMRYGQPGIIITFEEEPEKLYRDALVFGWDLQEYEKKNLLRVIPSSPEAVSEMLLSSDSGFSRLTSNIGASRIMVDSVTHFRRITDNIQQLRVLLSKFLTGLNKIATSSLLIKEIESSELEGANIEEYITDTVLRLSYEQRGKHRRERFLEVIKSRGQRHLSGKHTLKFMPSGLAVFPVCSSVQLPSPGAAGEPAEDLRTGPVRAMTGIKGLDQMCGGGFPAGSATVVAGSSGTGKTVLASQFIHQGLKKGERALILTFQQSPVALAASCRSFGVNLRKYLGSGQCEIMFRDSIGLSVDELLYEIRGRVSGSEKPRRVAVDGLTQLVQSISDHDYLIDYLGALLALFAQHGVTSIFTFEVDKMFGSFDFDSRRTLGLFDNMLLLRYVELEGDIRRALALLKMRGTDHDKSIPEFVITRSGIEVKTKFESGVEVMGGSAAPKVEKLELKDVLEDATRWVEANRKLSERQNRTLK
ncbi:MAG: ATPase domain-containing protein [Gemmatimonadota bacterium]|nr:ATPase domain-containing protein [Gemmatimonadota bacterium]